jgi:hypothetical protein
MQNIPAIGQKIEFAFEVEFWSYEPERLEFRADRWTTFVVESITTYEDEDHFNADVKCIEWNESINLDIEFDDWRPVA